MHAFLRQLLTVLFAGSILATYVFAQDNSALVGKWNMTSETQGDAVNWVLNLKEVDGKLAATLMAGDAEGPVKDFSYTGGVLRFKAPYQGEDYDIELKLAGTKLDGTWTGPNDSGHTSGTKAP